MKQHRGKEHGVAFGLDSHISRDTAEGWALNESGQWLYIENGKRVTGTKMIDKHIWE